MNSNGNLIVGANPETGAAFSCRVPEWRCNSFQLLSPEQQALLPTKHRSELLYVNLFANQTAIFIRAGRSPGNGLLLNVFDIAGKFTKGILLQLPQLSDLEPADKVKTLDPKVGPPFPSFVAGFGTKIIASYHRRFQLVVYEPNSSTP